MPRDLVFETPKPSPALTSPVLKILHRLHKSIEAKEPSQVNLNSFSGKNVCIYGWAVKEGIIDPYRLDSVMIQLTNNGLFAGTRAPREKHREIALERLMDYIRNEEREEIHIRSCKALINAI